MNYGIGRIPADVDPASQTLAAHQADALIRTLTADPSDPARDYDSMGDYDLADRAANAAANLAGENWRERDRENIMWHWERYGQPMQARMEAEIVASHRDEARAEMVELLERWRAQSAQPVQIAPTGTTPGRRIEAGTRCQYPGCRNEAAGHNPGAGQALCGSHWDEY